MPPLSELLKQQSLSGFEAAEKSSPSSPPLAPPSAAVGTNPYLRCPLPPFSATVDTLRQFNESGMVPARRVIPLPISSSTGNSTVTETAVTSSSSSSGGSGGGGTTPTSLTAKTITLSVPSILPGGSFQASVVLAKSYQLLQVTATVPVEFRLYSSIAARTSDRTRGTDVPVPFEVFSGIITDVVFDTAPYLWSWQNRIGANTDSPQTTNGYISIVNPTNGSLSPGTVTIRFLPLEQ